MKIHLFGCGTNSGQEQDPTPNGITIFGYNKISIFALTAGAP